MSTPGELLSTTELALVPDQTPGDITRQPDVIAELDALAAALDRQDDMAARLDIAIALEQMTESVNTCRISGCDDALHVAPRRNTRRAADGGRDRFASTKEARRYGELRLLKRAGQIWDLTLQPEFTLHAPTPGAPGCFKEVGVYRADFAYATREGTIIEDVKGVRTPLYRWKKVHVEIEYGVRLWRSEPWD
jgi:hypothetical protein